MNTNSKQKFKDLNSCFFKKNILASNLLLSLCETIKRTYIKHLKHLTEPILNLHFLK